MRPQRAAHLAQWWPGNLHLIKGNLVLAAALLSLVVAILLLVIGLLGGGDPVSLDMGPFNLNANATTVFLLGMATTLLFAMSYLLFRSAGRRAVSRRRDRKKVSELSEKLEAFERDRHKDESAASE